MVQPPSDSPLPSPEESSPARSNSFFQALRQLLSARSWLIALAGYWVALFTATHWPKHILAMPGGDFDKLAHFVAFSLLAVIIACAVRARHRRLTWRALLIIWVAILIYAALDEILQSFVGRSCDFRDWLADAAGAACGLLASRWVSTGWESRSPKKDQD